MAELPTISIMLGDYDDYISERNKIISKISQLKMIVGYDSFKEGRYHIGHCVLRSQEEKQLEYYDGYLIRLNETIDILSKVKEEKLKLAREINLSLRGKRTTTNKGMTN